MTPAPHIPTGIEAHVCDDIAQRQALGIAKYGQTVAENPLALRSWLQHQYEELLDAAVYARRAIAEIDNGGAQGVIWHALTLPVRDAMVEPKPSPKPAFVGDPRCILPPVPLGIKQLHPDARMPTYATDGSACFDLYVVDADNFKPHPRDKRAALFRTGLAFSIPEGWMIEIHSRSGQGFKEARRLSNCTGIIDGDYTDEVMVALHYDGDEDAAVVPIVTGDRIAQARIVPVQRADFHWIDDIPTTGRSGGMGSTGR